MIPTYNRIRRRDFFKKSVLIPPVIGMSISYSDGACPTHLNADNLNIIGPKEGYSPQIGTLVSMMTWMRNVILMPVRNLSVSDLDYLHDENSNRIGAMLLHLAATERIYQRMTFEGKKGWDGADEKKFAIAMDLGEEARKTIKGHDLNYYLDIMKEVRDISLSELKSRDDAWLLSVDESWGWGPTNNYCKWFHVVEHESNHNGQIKYIKSRIRGGKLSQD